MFTLNLIKIRYCYIYLLVIIISVLKISLCFTQVIIPETNNSLLRQWTIRDGLPHSSINTIIRDQTGYLWLGTDAGLVRFDGVHMTVYDRWNTPILENDRILSLHQDWSGVLWIGTDGGGFYARKNDRFIHDPRNRILRDHHIRALVSDLKNRLWVGTEYGLYRFAAQKAEMYTVEQGLLDNIITDLSADSLGHIWAATLRGGVAHFSDNLLRVFDEDDGLEEPAALSVISRKNNQIYSGTLNGVYSLSPVGSLFKPLPGTNYTAVTALVFSDDMRLWIGTRNDGLLYWKNGIIHRIHQNFISATFIHSLLKQPSGPLWIGTKNSGLIQYDQRTVSFLTDEILTVTPVNCLIETPEGIKWLGCDSGLYNLDKPDNNFTVKSAMVTIREAVTALHTDIKSNLWVGTDRSIYRLSPVKNKYNVIDELPLPAAVSVIRSDPAGNTWIGTEGGVYFISNHTPKKIQPVPFLSNLMIRDLIIDSKGPLYIGTRHNILFRSEKGYQSIDTISSGTDMNVICLYLGNNDILWAGTAGGGLKAYYKENWTTLSTLDGLPDNFIYSINPDKRGELWMSTSRGVFRVPEDSLLSYIRGNSSWLPLTWYDENQGMTDPRCTASGSPAVLTTESGTRWYPTLSGIAVFSFNDDTLPDKSPGVRIEQILVDGDSLSFDNSILLSQPPRRLTFRFTGFDSQAPGKLRFRFRLTGIDSVYRTLYPGDPRQAVYQNPDPGTYSFAVQAISNQRIRSKEKAVLTIIIVPPFYQRPIFISIIISLLFLTAAGLFTVRKLKILRKKRNKYKTTHLDSKRAALVMVRLRECMEKDKIYLDPDLTLTALSKIVGIHANYLSRLINEQFKMSYSDYINHFRIRDAQKLLSDPAHQEKTVLEILYEVGFYSKSVFNTAFKKFTGNTPSQFRKKHLST